MKTTTTKHLLSVVNEARGGVPSIAAEETHRRVRELAVQANPSVVMGMATRLVTDADWPRISERLSGKAGGKTRAIRDGRRLALIARDGYRLTTRGIDDALMGPLQGACTSLGRIIDGINSSEKEPLERHIRLARLSIEALSAGEFQLPDMSAPEEYVATMVDNMMHTQALVPVETAMAKLFREGYYHDARQDYRSVIHYTLLQLVSKEASGNGDPRDHDSVVEGLRLSGVYGSLRSMYRNSDIIEG